MELSQSRNNMLDALSITLQQFLHLRFNQIRLHRLLHCTHDTNGNSPVFWFIGKNQVMDLFDDAFRKQNMFFCWFAYIVK